MTRTPPRIAYLPGDGIGPEVLAAARRVLDAAGFQASWHEGEVGWEAWRRDGDALPAATLALLDQTDACLFGAVTSRPPAAAEAELPSHLQGNGLRYQSPILRIRRHKRLYLNIRHNDFLPGAPSALDDPPIGHRITILRENTEDLYVGAEAHPVPDALAEALDQHLDGFRPYADLDGNDVAVSLRVLTRGATRRLLEAAFDEARRQARDHIVIGEKANVLRATGSLVLDVAAEVADAHAGLAYRVANVDALAADLIQHPDRYGVIAATNLFGDILSDVAAATCGGLGLAASANIGADYALFEPVHGSAPDIAGEDRANPIAAIRSAAQLAAWCGQDEVAGRVEGAVAAVLADPQAPRTPDLGGAASTEELTAAVVAGLSNALPRTR